MLGINRAYAKNSFSKNLVKMVSVKIKLLIILRYNVDINPEVIFPFFSPYPPCMCLALKSCGCFEI